MWLRLVSRDRPLSHWLRTKGSFVSKESDPGNNCSPSSFPNSEFPVRGSCLLAEDSCCRGRSREPGRCLEILELSFKLLECCRWIAQGSRDQFVHLINCLRNCPRSQVVLLILWDVASTVRKQRDTCCSLPHFLCLAQTRTRVQGTGPLADWMGSPTSKNIIKINNNLHPHRHAQMSVFQVVPDPFRLSIYTNIHCALFSYWMVGKAHGVAHAKQILYCWVAPQFKGFLYLCKLTLSGPWSSLYVYCLLLGYKNV